MSRPAHAVPSPSPGSPPAADPEPHDDIVYPEALPFVAFHLAVVGIVWTGFSTATLLGALALYLVRMWAVTAGYHRYFSHRAYRTGRVFQFVLAFLGQTSGQRGVLWWAAIHRHHHLHSDTEEDVHSPRHTGFFHAHVGWIFNPRRNRADYDSIPDLTRYPELVWLDRHPYLPLLLLGLGVLAVGGARAFFVSYVLSTVVLYHCVFFINSLAHVVGTRRYVTGDDSRNNWWLALLTLGEGWHNNHHHYQSAAPQGWRWYEIDLCWYVLVALSWTGLVRDLRRPPEAVVKGEGRLGRKVVEKVAREVAREFCPDTLAARVRGAWEGRPTLDELRTRAARAEAEAEAWLAALELPHLPSADDLVERARGMVPHAPSLDAVGRRAREILAEAVRARLLRAVAEGTA